MNSASSDGTNVPSAVPVENTGEEGTRDSHWRETVFVNELMTGFVGNAGNPLSALTIASLADMGYTVNLAAAEPYTLPGPAQSGGRQSLVGQPRVEPIMMRTIPIVMPDDTLR